MFVEGGIQGGVPDCRDWIQGMIFINYVSHGGTAGSSMGSPYGENKCGKFSSRVLVLLFVIFIIRFGITCV